MKERVFIIIDGSNFYHRLHELELRGLLSFNYKEFGKFLASGNLFKAKYYIGIIRPRAGDMKADALLKNQQRLLSKLGKDGWEIGRGYILDLDGRYHEKGVDVQMATDLLVGAYEDLYDVAVLISSDTDLIPAIRKVREKRKKVDYVGFKHKISYALKANSDETKLLVKGDVEKFL